MANRKQHYFSGFKHWLKHLYWKVDNRFGEVLHFSSQKPFLNEIPTFSDERVNAVFLRDNLKWEHQEFIVKETDVMVEPQYGYALRGYRTIIGSSKKVGKFGIPSPLRTIQAKLTGNFQKLETGILLDGSLGYNYFYFHAIVINKIHLLRQHLNTETAPILVGSETYNRTYFQEFMKHPNFSDLNWVELIEPVMVKELTIAVPFMYHEPYWLTTKHLFQPKELPKPNDVIFVDRKNRTLSNRNEINHILNKYNVSTIDPGDLSVNEQAKVFSTASHVIGIHGAGMTNILFCQKNSTKVLEITPKTLLHSHYYWMCLMLGIEYDIIVGKGNPDVYGPFRLDPKMFESKLKEFLTVKT